MWNRKRSSQRTSLVCSYWVWACAAAWGSSVALGQNVGGVVRSKDCLTSGCHSDMIKAPHVHEPIKKNDCNHCHTLADENAHKFALTKSGSKMCLTCHASITQEIQNKNLHHHAPVRDGSCLACHDPHSSAETPLLRSSSNDLCLTCHGNLAAVKMKTRHYPFAEQTCDACHSSHASPHPDLLIESYPREFYSTYDEERFGLCFSCHDEELVSEAETTEDTMFRNGDRNLHHLHVAGSAKGRSCRICHTPHGGNQDRLIRSGVPYGSTGWILKMEYRADESGGSCGPACHAPRRYDRQEPVDLSKPIAWPLSGKANP